MLAAADDRRPPSSTPSTSPARRPRPAASSTSTSGTTSRPCARSSTASPTVRAVDRDPADAATFAANAATLRRSELRVLGTEAARSRGARAAPGSPSPSRCRSTCCEAVRAGEPDAGGVQRGDRGGHRRAGRRAAARRSRCSPTRQVALLVYNEQTSGARPTRCWPRRRTNGVAVVPVTETLPAGKDYLQLDDRQPRRASGRRSTGMTRIRRDCDRAAARATRAGLRRPDPVVRPRPGRRRGEFVAVLGANGSGKTSLLRVILGLQPLTAGRVDVAGRPARRGSEDIGYVPQQRRQSTRSPRCGPATSSARGWTGTAGASGCPAARSRRRGRSPRHWPRSAPTRTPTCRSGCSPAASSSGCGSPRRWSADPALLLCDEPLLSLDLSSQRVVTALVDRRRREPRHRRGVRDPRDQPGAAVRRPGALPGRRPVPDRHGRRGADLRDADRALRRPGRGRPSRAAGSSWPAFRTSRSTRTTTTTTGTGRWPVAVSIWHGSSTSPTTASCWRSCTTR